MSTGQWGVPSTECSSLCRSGEWGTEERRAGQEVVVSSRLLALVARILLGLEEGPVKAGGDGWRVGCLQFYAGDGSCNTRTEESGA